MEIGLNLNDLDNKIIVKRIVKSLILCDFVIVIPKEVKASTCFRFFPGGRGRLFLFDQFKPCYLMSLSSMVLVSLLPKGEELKNCCILYRGYNLSSGCHCMYCELLLCYLGCTWWRLTGIINLTVGA